MDEHFPGAGWLRLRRETLDALSAYRSDRGPSRAGTTRWNCCSSRPPGESSAGDPGRPRGHVRGRHRSEPGETFSRVRATLESAAAALDEVARVADAVLFEGYLLYPYRASAQKNRIRWQFGVLTPARGLPDEPSATRTETLLEPRAR